MSDSSVALCTGRNSYLSRNLNRSELQSQVNPHFKIVFFIVIRCLNLILEFTQMKKTDSSKPVAKSTNTTQKKVPTAASKATPQPLPVEGRKLRSSSHVPPTGQDQLQTINESAATATDLAQSQPATATASTQLTLPWRTRFGRQKAEDITSATLIIKGQIEKLRDYIPATRLSGSSKSFDLNYFKKAYTDDIYYIPQALQTQGIKKQLQRDVVHDISKPEFLSLPAEFLLNLFVFS